jgi:hypothetical protein
MKLYTLLLAAIAFFCSCSNSGKGTTFCDTTCKKDSFVFEGDDKLKQSVSISVHHCEADTLAYTHVGKKGIRKMDMHDLLKGKAVKLNESALETAFLDTTTAWVSFNDCISGRGYLLKINLTYTGGVSVLSGALNRFDKKFSIDPDLRAYTDRGNIYVDNVKTGKSAQMTFKEEYADMKFDEIHKVLDSINVTKSRIYVKLIKEGKEVPIEKKIDLQ